jgi:hypothetical protein
MKGRGLSANKANARAMLKEKRATTLTQFLGARVAKTLVGSFKFVL